MSLSDPGFEPVALELSAVIVAVTDDEPRVLVVGDGSALPSGPLESGHRTLELGLRAWVERLTQQKLGYVEQLYTFADRDRLQTVAAGRLVSLSYLALAREVADAGTAESGWSNWYRYFPWEDWRQGPNILVRDVILPRLRDWAGAERNRDRARTREQRIAGTFTETERHWNEELVLQRFELLYEAGLIPEAARAAGVPGTPDPVPGAPMIHDHRRILATGIARLRAKSKYRPVVFELMPTSFTLSQLQRAVEALAGRRLHKQNFRRFIEQQRLVEETGEIVAGTGGRPARLVRFRREVLQERAVAGTKLPLARSG
jgi:hypothetical protein